jgi:hypothetical protein
LDTAGAIHGTVKIRQVSPFGAGTKPVSKFFAEQKLLMSNSIFTPSAACRACCRS